MYKATTSDVITKVAYGTSVGTLSKPDYNVRYYSGVDKLYDFLNVSLCLPWLGPLMESLPPPTMSKLVPELVPFLEMKDVSRLPFDEAASSSSISASNEGSSSWKFRAPMIRKQGRTRSSTVFFTTTFQIRKTHGPLSARGSLNPNGSTGEHITVAFPWLPFFIRWTKVQNEITLQPSSSAF